jgi:hypothetical protein
MERACRSQFDLFWPILGYRRQFMASRRKLFALMQVSFYLRRANRRTC